MNVKPGRTIREAIPVATVADRPLPSRVIAREEKGKPRDAAGPATLALAWAALCLAFVFVADLSEFLLTGYLDSPTVEYLQKLLQRHWREVDYGLPFLARYLGAGALFAGLLYLIFLTRRRPIARYCTALCALLAVVWFFLRGATYASLNVQLNTTLLQYLFENGALIFEAEGADVTSGRVPLALYAYLILFALAPVIWLVAGGRTRQGPGPEHTHRWHHGLATLTVFTLAAALSFLSGDGLAGSLAPSEPATNPGRPTASGDALPPPEAALPRTYSFENAFRKRYGFRLKPGTSVVVFFLESARAAFVPLEKTRHFRPGDRKVITVDDFYVPVPHSSNSHYSLFTGLHSARKAKDGFDSIRRERTLPGTLAREGYTSYYLYGGDAKFDAENRMLNKLGIRIREKKHLRAKRGPDGKRLYKEFWWGVDDRALLDETREILARESGPLFLSIVYTNSHHRYFNPHPDRYKEHDNTTDIGRHRNAIRYALDLSDQIVDEFHDRGRGRDTLFILLSDHGESFGEHGFIVHDFSLYNTEVKIPFAMRHPDFRRLFDHPRFPAGNVLDVFPTVVDLLGLPFEGEIHGRSLFAPDYQLRLLLRAWGSDDYVGLIDGGRKWLYSRPRRELLRADLSDGNVQSIPLDRRARALVKALHEQEF